MAEQAQTKKKGGAVAKALKLFALTVVVLLVPLVLDQLEVDPESVKIVGRVAAAVTVVLILYGMFTKLLKFFGFVIAGLTVLVVLVSEGVIKAPRLTEMLSQRDSSNR